MAPNISAVLSIGLLLLTISNANAESVITDPYISCEGMHPPGLPPGYSESFYNSALALCSPAHGPNGKTLGCTCFSSHTQVRCRRRAADPVLWGATSTTRGVLFRDWCELSCQCGTMSSATTSLRNNKNWQELDEAFPVNPPSDQEATPTGSAQADGEGGDDADSSWSGSDTPGIDYMEIPHHAPVANFQNQCGNNCTSNKDCGNQGCSCSTQSEQYMPGKGTVAFMAACIVSLGGKRDEGRPCPCNETYVSHACCGAEDGMVWEGKEFKLGELVRRNASGGGVQSVEDAQGHVVKGSTSPVLQEQGQTEEKGGGQPAEGKSTKIDHTGANLIPSTGQLVFEPGESVKNLQPKFKVPHGCLVAGC